MTWRPTRALRAMTALDSVMMAALAYWLAPPRQLFPHWLWTGVFIVGALGLAHVAIAPANRWRRALAVGVVTFAFGGLAVVQILMGLDTGFTASRKIIMTIWIVTAVHIVVRMTYWPAFDNRTLDDLPIFADPTLDQSEGWADQDADHDRWADINERLRDEQEEL